MNKSRRLERSYMRKSVKYSWVKNVNSLSFNSGIKSVILPTVGSTFKQTSQITNVKPLVIRPFTHQFNQYFSTTKKSIYDLLNMIYTHNPQHLLLEPKKKI